MTSMYTIRVVEKEGEIQDNPALCLVASQRLPVIFYRLFRVIRLCSEQNFLSCVWYKVLFTNQRKESTAIEKIYTSTQQPGNNTDNAPTYYYVYNSSV